MRRRDVLKIGLILAAIPVGANMIWQKLKTREDHIRERTFKLLRLHEDDRHVAEALPLVNDVLDLAFDIRSDSGSVPCLGDVEPYVYTINRHLEELGVDVLSVNEKNTIYEVYTLIRKNYSHRVSSEVIEVLCIAGIMAKAYQMRPDLPM